MNITPEDIFKLCTNNNLNAIKKNIAKIQQSQLPALVVNAAYMGHVEIVRYFMNSKDLLKHHLINPTFFDELVKTICCSGNVDLIYDVLTTPEINTSNIVYKPWNLLKAATILKAEYNSPDLMHVDLRDACLTGHVNSVKKVLSIINDISPFITPIVKNKAFVYCCEQGRTELMKFFLLQEKIDIHVQDDLALFKACENNQQEVVQYLLESSELVEHSNINAKCNYYRTFYSDQLTWHPFALACTNAHFTLADYLYNFVSPQQCEELLIFACKQNNMAIFKYLEPLSVDQVEKSFMTSCEYGNLDAVEYLCQHHKIPNIECGFSGAIASHQKKVLHYLIQHYDIDVAPYTQPLTECIHKLVAIKNGPFSSKNLQQATEAFIQFLLFDRNLPIPQDLHTDDSVIDKMIEMYRSYNKLNNELSSATTSKKQKL